MDRYYIVMYLFISSMYNGGVKDRLIVSLVGCVGGVLYYGLSLLGVVGLLWVLCIIVCG